MDDPKLKYRRVLLATDVFEEPGEIWFQTFLVKGAPQRISHAHPHAAAAGKSAGELFVATGKKTVGNGLLIGMGLGYTKNVVIHHTMQQMSRCQM